MYKVKTQYKTTKYKINTEYKTISIINQYISIKLYNLESIKFESIKLYNFESNKKLNKTKTVNFSVVLNYCEIILKKSKQVYKLCGL